MVQEVNFDGLVGPTHNYAGLSKGNLASEWNKGETSSPKQAVLQGLEKMIALHRMGFVQALIPPQPRPYFSLLQQFGYKGSEEEIIKAVAVDNPQLLINSYSAAAMWTANAATVCPSADSADGACHFTPANLRTMQHRAVEAPVTSLLLRSIFPEQRGFVHHMPLDASGPFGDEGAANHTRFCSIYSGPGVHFFVYGCDGSPKGKGPKRFPARQSYEASKELARLHGIAEERLVFAQQSPAIIDAGAFHNDVVSVGNQNVYLYHECAFDKPDDVVSEIREKLKAVSETDLIPICVKEADVSVKDTVKSYLFNSQILSRSNGEMVLIAHKACYEIPAVRSEVDRIVADPSNPINEVHYYDLRQSMKNGGGPACLRLRVVLTDEELAAVHRGVIMTEKLFETLCEWANEFYRDSLAPQDLRDPSLWRDSQLALEALLPILELPKSLYVQSESTISGL